MHQPGVSDASATAAASPVALVLPLALAQFLASYDTQAMSVAISRIVDDLDTTVTGVQTAMSVFTLTMAALMIPGSKLTDIWGRKVCFRLGMVIYGLGALLTAFSPTLGIMIAGYSILEGIGSALMIPPIYILITVMTTNSNQRTKGFAIVSAAAALGAACGPLLGGIITTAWTWRVSYALEVLVVLLILYLGRRLPKDDLPAERPAFDLLGAVLSALGLVCIVLGILQAGTYGWIKCRKDFSIGDTTLLNQGDISPVILLVLVGFGFLALFFWHIERRERSNREPLISPKLFKVKVADLGFVVQNMQWFMMVGTFFIVSVFMQVSRGYDAIETGLVVTPATVGILLSAFRMGKITSRFSQRTIIRLGFVIAFSGTILMLLLPDSESSVLLFAPGLFLIGFGAGVMLTAAVNVVQSSVPEKDQGEISGVSRSVSNLGSSLGTAVAGAVLISALISGLGSGIADSTVLSPGQKDQLNAVVQKSVSAVSDAQVQAALEGQPQDVIDEVTRINADARDRALGLALFAVGLIALIGLGAAMFLPEHAGAAEQEQTATSSG
jgi:MFS family permease